MPTQHGRELVELALAGDVVQLADRAAPGFWKAENQRRAAAELAKQGRAGEAAEHADRALAFYRSVRATRFIRELESLLEQIATAEEGWESPA